MAFLLRHWCGHWGEVNAEDAVANDLSLIRGKRLLSVYTMSRGTKIWIFTERDRSYTTILLPSEY
ncbi:MAG: plasmid related protein [Acidobacteria bacterium]|nr:plasmid related protein [Acidobacteriota bacterium]